MEFGWVTDYIENVIDLRSCVMGDILISTHGTYLMYIGPCVEDEYMDHRVKYLDPGLGNGTRTHDGYVFRDIRIPETDEDIKTIIHVDDPEWERHIKIVYNMFPTLGSITINGYTIYERKDEQVWA